MQIMYNLGKTDQKCCFCGKNIESANEVDYCLLNEDLSFLRTKKYLYKKVKEVDGKILVSSQFVTNTFKELEKVDIDIPEEGSICPKCFKKYNIIKYIFYQKPNPYTEM